MNTRTLIILLITYIGGLAIAQVEVPGTPEWMVTFRVTDQDGTPVANANVFASYYIPPQPNETEAGSQAKGLTDTNGLVTLTAHSGPAIGYGAEKEGYYSTTSVGYNFDFRNKTGGQWHPWNPMVNIVLKKVGHPIPMYAKRILSLKVPEFNKVIGYDLMVGDWVGPYGKGINADLFFTETHTDPTSGYIFSVSFPNAGDGIQEFTVPDNEKNSGLRSANEAPADGYQPSASQTQTTDPNRNFYFRVHTKLDENGSVVSARYGKIYGDLSQFSYYYNPTPNDRNVEFEPKQNLLGSLRSFEQVHRP